MFPSVRAGKQAHRADFPTGPHAGFGFNHTGFGFHKNMLRTKVATSEKAVPSAPACRRAVILVCLLLFGPAVHADGGESQPGDSAGSQVNLTAEQAMQQVRENLADEEKRWYAIMRARWSYPQKISAGMGLLLTRQRSDADCSNPCTMYGWHFEVEPGLYGVQGSVGWGKVVAESGSTKRLLHTVYFGWAFRGVVLRTWGDGPLTPTEQTLVGVEADYSLLRVNYSLGIMRSLTSSADRDWVISVGMGWGF